MINQHQINTILELFESNFFTSVYPDEKYIVSAVRDLFPAKIQSLATMPDNPYSVALQGRLSLCLMGDGETLSTQVYSIQECFNTLAKEIYHSKHYDIQSLKSIKLGTKLDQSIALNYGPAVSQFYAILPEMRVEYNRAVNLKSFLKLQQNKLVVYRPLQDLATRHCILKTSLYWQLLRCELPIIKSRIEEALIRYKAGSRRVA